MALNYPGPYQLKLYYTVNTFQHVLNLNLNVVGTPTPGTPFTAINVVTPDASNPLLSTVAANLSGWLEPIFSAATSTFDTAELWRIAANSFDGTFISSMTIGTPGIHGSPAVGGGEVIFVFRTQEGGTMRVHLEEPITIAGPTIPYASMGPAYKAIADFILAQSSPFLGRDTSPPISAIAYYPGQNERVFKARNR